MGTLDVEEECEEGEVDDNDSVCSDGELEMKQQRNSDASDSTLVGTPAEKKTTIEFSPSAKKENNYKQGSIIKEWSMFSLARSQASQLTLPTTMSTISIAQTKRSETSPAGTLRRMSRAQSRMTVEEKKAWLASVAGPEAPAVHWMIVYFTIIELFQCLWQFVSWSYDLIMEYKNNHKKPL